MYYCDVTQGGDRDGLTLGCIISPFQGFQLVGDFVGGCFGARGFKFGVQNFWEAESVGRERVLAHATNNSARRGVWGGTS
ncbi:MAG: hypothetical protein JWR19_3793 [Pedosphaera sp.]|nr:hypothetical protein [Pedosphaera sp.]